MRRSIGVVFLVLALLQPTASSAAPQRTPDGPSIEALLADLDADGLSDALEARLDRLAADEPVSVVITFDGRGGVATARDAVGSFDVTRRFQLVRGFAATMTKAQALDLAAEPGVFRVEQDVRVHAFLDSADADFGTERARTDFGVTGAGVEVCIVDTGVDPNHEQLDGKAPIAFFDAVAGLSIA